MYNKKILFSIPPIDFIGMNTSNWTLKIICVVDRRVFLVHTWIKGKTKMMAKSTVTQSLKSFIAAPFISQNAGLASWSSSQVLLVCCWDKWPLSDEFQNTKQQQTQNRYLTTPPENYTQLNTTTIQMSSYVHSLELESLSLIRWKRRKGGKGRKKEEKADLVMQLAFW